MPAVTQQASAFVFSVTTTLRNVGEARIFGIGLPSTTLALSLTTSHAPTLLGNRELSAHKLPWQPRSATT